MTIIDDDEMIRLHITKAAAAIDGYDMMTLLFAATWDYIIIITHILMSAELPLRLRHYWWWWWHYAADIDDIFTMMMIIDINIT